MAPMLRCFLLFAAVVTLSLAVPTSEPYSSNLNEQIGARPGVTRTLFQRFRNSIIERIWDVPKRTNCHTSGARPDHAAPANFRSKYGRDIVLRFRIDTEDEAKAFSEAASILYLDVWDQSSDWVDIRIAKEMLPSLLNLLPTSLRSSYTPLTHDLARSVYDTYPSPQDHESWRTRHNPVQKHQHDLIFSDYQPLSVLYPWLRLMSSLFPNHAQSFSIGKSYEGREIPAIRIGAPITEQAPDHEVNGRKTILIVGGSHAREWISTSTVSFLAYSFATRYGQSHSSAITKILQHYDIIFVPVLNPDGYEYTWSTDRLWRKNRQATSLPFCPGIDLDRAYPFRWDGESEVDNPCTESYAGEHPLQAVEAKVLADWARNQTRDKDVVFTTFLDLHSYSQKILFPYSYSCDDEPSNLEDLEEAAEGIAKAFRLTAGHFYQVTSACDSQFACTHEKDGKKVRSQIDSASKNGGSALDYFYEELRVKWAYQIKLRDTGTYGFLLPKENIVPTGRETFEAVVGLGRYLLGNRGIESDNEEDGVSGSVVESVDEQDRLDSWRNQSPAYIFQSSQDHKDKAESDYNDNDDDDEWERVYDEELRRRRR